MDVDLLRKDFPILSNGIIYLDSASTSLTPEPVLEKLVEFYRFFRASPGRSIHSASRRAEGQLSDARKTAADIINASVDEIVFTRNTTEGLNMVAGGLNIEKGGNIVVSALEHHSNFLPWMERCKRDGREFRIVFPKSNDGLLTSEDFAEKIDHNTRVVALAHVSNVLGTILPVEETAKIAHENNAYVVVDAAQSAPHMQIDVDSLDVDFLALSGHKACGPTGSGLLYVKREHAPNLRSIHTGGGTVISVEPTNVKYLNPPGRLEGGTLAFCEIMAMAEALKYVKRIGFDQILKHDKDLLKAAYEKLEGVKGLELYGPTAEKRINTLTFNIQGIEPTEVAKILDSSDKIAVRSGHLCAQILTKEVLCVKEGLVRASTYFYNNEEEIDILTESIKKIVYSRA